VHPGWGGMQWKWSGMGLMWDGGKGGGFSDDHIRPLNHMGPGKP
jgi:hypothetical protein